MQRGGWWCVGKLLKKMEFCPTCANMLRFEIPEGGGPRFYCLACPYVCSIERNVKIKRKQRLVKKEIEPVFSQDDMKNCPTTDASCDECFHGKAYFQQLQIRSADEPMTNFYCCIRCSHRWND